MVQAQVKNTHPLAGMDRHAHTCTRRHMYTNSEACAPTNQHAHIIHAHTVNLCTHVHLQMDVHVHAGTHTLTHKSRGLQAPEGACMRVHSSHVEGNL